jgi:hypothetical protein
MRPETARATTEKPQCDFCGAEPFYAYSAVDFVMMIEEQPSGRLVEHESTGAWLACRKCSRYIDGGRYSSLYDVRTSPSFVRRGIPAPVCREIRPVLLEIWRTFEKNRKGEKVIFG